MEVFTTILTLAILNGILLFGIIWLASYRFNEENSDIIINEKKIAVAKKQTPDKK